MNQKAEVRIFIIDDNEPVRRSLSLLLMSAGYHVESFENATSFLDTEEVTGPGCILLDIFLIGESGLDLQDAISKKFPALPIIFITGQGDIPMSVRALKHGALDFLQKPIDEKLLFRAIKDAIDLSRVQFEKLKEKNSALEKVNSLTPREYEVLRLILKGNLNKQIAAELNIAEHTVKLHRAKITSKLGVKSVPDIIYLIGKMNN
jgi:FixJ family two-component response regulator